jgi:ribosome-binding protein aMBF1 (putative translation factor)
MIRVETMTTAEKIKELRKVTGWSQEELAVRLHCSFATVNRWESSKYEPMNVYARALQKMFNRYLPVGGTA